MWVGAKIFTRFISTISKLFLVSWNIKKNSHELALSRCNYKEEKINLDKSTVCMIILEKLIKFACLLDYFLSLV